MTTASHPGDADHVDSGIAEHLVHPVLVDHYAPAGSPDEVPHQLDTASPQPAQVTPFSESRCGAVPYVDAAEDMRHEPRAVGERGAVGDSKAAHRQRVAPRAPFEHKHIEARTGQAVGRDAPTETAPDDHDVVVLVRPCLGRLVVFRHPGPPPWILVSTGVVAAGALDASVDRESLVDVNIQ